MQISTSGMQQVVLYGRPTAPLRARIDFFCTPLWFSPKNVAFSHYLNPTIELTVNEALLAYELHIVNK